jgi:hypothetical protein
MFVSVSGIAVDGVSYYICNVCVSLVKSELYTVGGKQM